MLHPLIRVVEKHVIDGKGLATTGFIKAGEVVSKLEPGQPTVPIDEALAMSQDEQDDLLHFCYQCDEDNLVCEDGDEKYMNHSCDPNTWWLDDETMIARRDILPGEEITYDYSTTEITIPFTMACRCGSANCRGTISHLDYQLPAWQAQYGQHLPSFTLKAIAKAKE